MSIKKKLGLGVASGALGLAMIGGGTWAAFNDVETLDSKFKAGTLDLDVSELTGSGFATEFHLGNLKPGESMTRKFVLSNEGSLAIKDVLLDAQLTSFSNGENEYVDDHNRPDNGDDGVEYLEQFKVEILRIDDRTNTPFQMIFPSDNYTLADLVDGEVPSSLGSAAMVGDRINLAPANGEYTGIPVNPEDTETVEIKITFVSTNTEDEVTGEYVQNKFQGDSATIDFVLEARQHDANPSTNTPNHDPEVDNYNQTAE